MKFGQENKFFLGSSHHGVFSPSLIFSFRYTQPYPSLRSIHSSILHSCSSSFILSSFILGTHHSFIHSSLCTPIIYPSSLPLIIHPSILDHCTPSIILSSFIPAPHHLSIHPSSLQLIIHPSTLHPCTSSFIHPSFILAPYHSS